MQMMMTAILAGTCATVLLVASLYTSDGLSPATAKADEAAPFAVAQAKTYRKRQRRYARSRTFVFEGAASSWPNSMPVDGGLANQDAAGAVPQVLGLSGPGALGPGPDW